MSEAVVECIGLRKELASGARMLTILDGIDLSVDPGEFVAILGPSGSGKSTLLGLMAGLDLPSSGTIKLARRALNGLDEDELALLRREHVGFVFQSFQLLENLTARENVLLPMELTGFEGAAERTEELLARIGLAERGHHYPAELSGGEQQRVALARAFGPRPTVLFADEPTGNLDSRTGETVMDLFLELRAKENTTLVLVTHDPALAQRAERRIHLDAGRIVREERGESPGETVDRPASAGVAGDGA